jgi:Ca2+-dependent lipid-binding protein
VTIFEAGQLRKMDMFGKNDVYVKLTMAGKTKRSTTVSKGGEAPLWNNGAGETLEFVGLKEPPQQLNIVVWDEDTFGKDDLIGDASYDLADPKLAPLDKDWTIDTTLALSTEVKGKVVAGGELRVQIKSFVPITPPEPLKRRLFVTILEGSDLKKMDFVGENDVYVSMEVGGSTKRTTTVKDSGTPKWKAGIGETFQFSLTEILLAVELKAYDEDLGKDDFIGGCKIGLKGMTEDRDWSTENSFEIFDLKERKTGELKASVKWHEPIARQNEAERVLHVTIVQASNLKKMDLFGKNDVYCTANVSDVLKKTSTIDNGGSAPKWRGGAGETLKFPQLEQAPSTVEITCYDEDKWSDDVIGVVFIDIEEKPTNSDWTMDKFFGIVDGKGKSTGMVRVVLDWKLPPPVCPGTLLVTMLRGRDLKSMETFGKNDVYCNIVANGVSKRTQTIHNGGATPVWEKGKGETLKYRLRDMMPALEVGCFDEDIGRDDLIGNALLELHHMPPAAEWELEKWVSLTVNKSNVETGKLHVRLQWTPDPPDPDAVIEYHTSGLWHVIGRELQQTAPLVPPFVTPPPPDYMEGLQLLNLLQMCFQHPVVSEALLDEPSVFMRLFQHPDVVAMDGSEVDEDDIEQLFATIDDDGSGVLDHDEFRSLSAPARRPMGVQVSFASP